MREDYPENQDLMQEYFKPLARWAHAFQNDFAARADWCVKSYDEANHPPTVQPANALDMKARPGETVSLSAEGTTDPDGDALSYRWWQYCNAGSYDGSVEIDKAGNSDALLLIPADAKPGQTIHVICEVTDAGAPPLTRYQRVVIELKP